MFLSFSKLNFWCLNLNTFFYILITSKKTLKTVTTFATTRKMFLREYIKGERGYVRSTRTTRWASVVVVFGDASPGSKCNLSLNKERVNHTNIVPTSPGEVYGCALYVIFFTSQLPFPVSYPRINMSRRKKSCEMTAARAPGQISLCFSRLVFAELCF